MRIIIGAHGKLGLELINSAGMVFGELDNVQCVSLMPGMSFEEYREKAEAALRACGNDRILVLIDLFGGTPCNVFSALSKKYGCDVVTGVNLPVLIELYACISSEATDIGSEELVTRALEVLHESGIHTNSLLACRDR